jgi:hypothetical protein
MLVRLFFVADKEILAAGEAVHAAEKAVPVTGKTVHVWLVKQLL